MEASAPNPKDIEIAMRMLDAHRKAMVKSYYKHKDKRIAYARSYYAKKKEAKKAEAEQSTEEVKTD